MPTEEDIQRIEQYILINHEYETTSDLMRSLEIPWRQVVKYCRKLNVIPATPVGLLVEYAREHHKHMSLSEMAEHLDVHERYLLKQCKLNNIEYYISKERKKPVATEPWVRRDFSDAELHGVMDILLEMGLRVVPLPGDNFRIVPAECIAQARPRAEYDVRISSEIVREEYAERGLKMKK